MGARERLAVHAVRDQRRRRGAPRRAGRSRCSRAPASKITWRALRLHAGLLGEVRDLDARPRRVEHRPAGDAVDVAGLLDLRQLRAAPRSRARTASRPRRGRAAGRPRRARSPSVAAHRAQALEHALAGRQRGPARRGGLLGAAGQVVGGEAVQRAAERDERGAGGGGLAGSGAARWRAPAPGTGRA